MRMCLNAILISSIIPISCLVFRLLVGRDIEGELLTNLDLYIYLSVISLGMVYHLLRTMKQLDEEKRWFHQHDPLTKLYNRSFFIKKLMEFHENWLFGKQKKYTLALFKILNFKPIIYEYGLYSGEQMISITSELVNKVLPKEVIFARLSANEFGLLIPDLVEDEILPELEKFYDLLSETRMPANKGQSVQLDLALGGVSPEDDIDIITLYGDAARALYDASQSIHRRVIFFADSQNK